MRRAASCRVFTPGHVSQSSFCTPQCCAKPHRRHARVALSITFALFSANPHDFIGHVGRLRRSPCVAGWGGGYLAPTPVRAVAFIYDTYKGSAIAITFGMFCSAIWSLDFCSESASTGPTPTWSMGSVKPNTHVLACACPDPWAYLFRFSVARQFSIRRRRITHM